MTFSAPARKLALTVHVSTSLGWLGAVAAFLALAINGIVDQGPTAALAAYPAMGLVYFWVVIPFGLASLASGFVSSLGTEWGLLRHYWVAMKLLMTIPLTALMFVHGQPVDRMRHLADGPFSTSGSLGALKVQLALYAGAALLALVVATTLSIYKPKGITPIGAQRRLRKLSRA